MNLCRHGMPSPASCYDCMEEGVFVCGRRKRTVHGVGLTVETDPFPARYDGHCDDCNTAIHEGELIVRMSDQSYQHAIHHQVSGWS